MTSGAESETQKRARFTIRDAQILEALHAAEFLTTHQVRNLYFTEGKGGKDGLTKACERRMRLLYHAGLVRRIEQPVTRGEGSKPYVYALTRKGAEFLVAEAGIDPAEIDWRPKSFEANPAFLSHLLATTDFRIALLNACKGTDIAVAQWTDEREFRMSDMMDYVMLTGPNGQEKKTAVIPDAVFMLGRAEKKALFMVEIDMRTVTVEPRLWDAKGWAKKVRAYMAWFNSESFLMKYEGRRARVLTITTGEKRLNNLLQVTERVAGENKDLFWFTTFEQAMDPSKLLTAPIWTVVGSDTPHSLLR